MLRSAAVRDVAVGRKGGTGMTKFKAVVFDWAGTTVDFGSFARWGGFS